MEREITYSHMQEFLLFWFYHCCCLSLYTAIHSVPTSSSDLRPQHSAHSSNHGNHGYGSRPATYSTNSAASYANAVQIYTQKLSTLRPRSATSAGQKTGRDLLLWNLCTFCCVVMPVLTFFSIIFYSFHKVFNILQLNRKGLCQVVNSLT